MERIKMQMKITCGERVSPTLLITSFLSVFCILSLCQILKI